MSDFICPSCKARLKGPRVPGLIYRHIECGAKFYIPPIARPR